MNTENQTRSGSQSGSPYCSPSLHSLKGLKGIEYRKAWNKLNREKCRLAVAEYKKRNPEKVKENLKKWVADNPEIVTQYRARMAKKNGAARCTVISRKSEEFATMARQRWGPVEDVILTCGKYTETELVQKLGRSIRAIQRRKWRLRQDDSLENDQVQPVRTGSATLNPNKTSK